MGAKMSRKGEIRRVRAAIVAEYASVWAHAHLADLEAGHPALPPPLVYLDLYHGPDRGTLAAYEVLRTVVAHVSQDALLQENLLVLLNDPGPENPDARRALARALRPLRYMRYTAQVFREYPWPRIEARLRALTPRGILIYVEPWGYRGLSGPDLHHWARMPQAELLLALRYPLLNMGLANARVQPYLAAFWGAERAQALYETMEQASPEARQERLIAACEERLKELGAAYVRTLRLGRGHRLVDILIHAARTPETHGLVKEVFAKYSTRDPQGVPDYRYDPMMAHYGLPLPLFLPPRALADEIVKRFAGRTLSVEEVYQHHHAGQPYIRQNYADAFQLLLSEGRAQARGHRIHIPAPGA